MDGRADLRPLNAPPRVELPGLVLRRWGRADAPLLQDALDASRADLLVWTPWVLEGVDDPSALERRVDGYRMDFEEGDNLLYAVFDPTETRILGGAGLYGRVGPQAMEVGYWVRSDAAGRGIASASAAALCEIGLSLPGVSSIELHCRSDHLASIRIAVKLGFVHAETRPPSRVGAPPTMIWCRRGDTVPT